MYLKILFPILCAAGLYFLLKSIGNMIRLYSSDKFEFSARQEVCLFNVNEYGEYEIAVKRPSLVGAIPTNICFELLEVSNQNKIVVRKALNLFSQRKDLTGNRIVPISEFTASGSGPYELLNSEVARFNANDRLVIMPKTGTKGFVLIFAILFSAILTIGGLVLTILAFTNRL